MHTQLKHKYSDRAGEQEGCVTDIEHTCICLVQNTMQVKLMLHHRLPAKDCKASHNQAIQHSKHKENKTKDSSLSRLRQLSPKDYITTSSNNIKALQTQGDEGGGKRKPGIWKGGKEGNKGMVGSVGRTGIGKATQTASGEEVAELPSCCSSHPFCNNSLILRFL